MTDLSKLLNPEQLEAATAPDGPLLILAAAGTGKTRTLVYRVVHLIERGFQPSELMLITFTNRAAREMLDRAEQVAPGITSGLWGGTFHHIANRILRKYGPRIGYPNDFTILDADDQKSLMGQCLKAEGFTPKKHPNFPKREVILSLVSGAVNRGIDFGDYLENKTSVLGANPDDIMKVANAYYRRKFDMHAMDFDDLLVKALELFNEHEDVSRYYQERFRHVLVDEYQDTNALQSEFVELLAAGHNNLSVVGDDFQCIYSWRGSDYQNIMQFPQRHPGARIIKLERNYRSRPEILSVANESIKHNTEQFQKVLRPTRASDSRRPILYDVYSGREQSDRVLEIIGAAKAEGFSYNDIAVLYRAHFHSIDLQIALSQHRVPHAITSGVGFFEQAHAKDVIALLRLCEFPAESLAFARVLGLLDGVGPATVERIWQKLGGAFMAEDADQRNNLIAFLPAKARAQWTPISNAIAECKANNSTPEAVATLVNDFASRFYESHLHKTYDNAKDRLDDVRELAADVQSRGDVRDFLTDIALMTNVDREGEREARDKPRVLLSTIHQAKGLEWPIVIILWAVEGMFPSNRAIAEDADDSEERRLFYVAVTRAKEGLHIMTPRMRQLYDGGSIPCEPSRFVREIPPNLLESKGSSFRQRSFSSSLRYGYNRSYR
ncbi:MAG: ATP-dependent helicase [Kiritimatiellia bacterium]|jgi:DNA helicase-2/ATP-dependent DNA helicase PcrA